MPRNNTAIHSLSLKSQQVMSPSAASAMLEPDKKNILSTGKNYTLWEFWMRGRLLKKGLGVICSEDQKDSRLTSEGAGAKMHQVHSAMSRAGPEE